MRALSVVVFLVLTGCGGGTAATGADVVVSAEPIRGTGRWDDMTFEQRHAEMTFRVLPNMGRSFQRFYGTEYAELSCTTCHGDDAEAVDYRMPNGLPALDPAALPRADSDDEDEAQMARFMVDVTERLAGWLDAREFSCFSCHPGAGAAK